MRLRPIYRRDSIVMSRGMGLPFLLTVLNAILMVVIFFNLYTMVRAAELTGEMSYASFLRLYRMAVAAQIGISVVVLPAMTAGSISGEREKHTLDLLLMTRLRAVDIIIGKMLAAVGMVVFLLISSLPILATVFIYGGVSMKDVVITISIFVVCILFSAAAGIFSSSFISSSTVATVAAYAIIAATGMIVTALGRFWRQIHFSMLHIIMLAGGILLVLTVLFVLLGCIMIQQRHEKRGE